MNRPDYVPAEPIRRALRRFLLENGAGELVPRSEYQPGSERSQRYSGAYFTVAERAGVRPDTVYAWASRSCFQGMHFDVADRILAATDQVSLWWQDPQLSEVYERACKGADRVAPLQKAA